MSQNFCNILVVRASLWYVAEADQAVEWYHVWLIVSWQLVRWHAVCGFPPCVIWKSHRWTCLVPEFENLYFELVHKAAEKHLLCEEKNCSWSQYRNQRGKKLRTSCKNLDDQVRSSKPKTVDLRPYSKPQKHIRRVAFREYQVNPASHSPMGLVTFTTKAAVTKILQNSSRLLVALYLQS